MKDSLGRFETSHDDKLRTMFAVHDGVGDVLAHWTRVFSDLETAREVYHNFLCVMADARKVTRHLAADDPGRRTIDTLIDAMHALDAECGKGVEPVRPDMSRIQQARALRALDRDLVKFDSLLRHHVRQVRTLDNYRPALQFFQLFARLTYDCNGYQAPPRTDPLRAMADAAGESDVFWERFGDASA